jgi:Spy/CpxP family protein refolding chaperone
MITTKANAMNIFTKNRILIGAVILLGAINLAILGTLGFHYTKPQEPTNPRESFRNRTNYGKSIANELNLTPEQEEIFETLRQEYFNETQSIRREIQTNHRLIIDELDKENPDRAKLDSLAIAIGQLHEEQQFATIEHFLTLRESCSPEQYQTLQQLFRRAMPQGQRMLNRDRRHSAEPPRNRRINE